MTVVRETKQLQAVLETLCDKGFAEILKPLFLQVELPEVVSRPTLKTIISRLIDAIKTLGSPYIEFAQKLSLSLDKLPISWCEAFSQLKGHTVSFPFEKVAAVIQTELGGRLEMYFSSFDKTPIEVTYFSQTLRAELRSGEKVFVKVVRPEVRAEVEASFEVVSHLAEQIYRAFDFGKDKVVPLLDDLRDALKEELDLTKEAQRRHYLGELFQHEKGLVVPKVFSEYSTPSVLTYEAYPLTTTYSSGFIDKLIFEMGIVLEPMHLSHSFEERGLIYLYQKQFWKLTDLERQALSYLFMGLKEGNVYLTIVALQRLSPNPEKFLAEDVEEGISSIMDSSQNRGAQLLRFLSFENIGLNKAVYLALKQAFLEKQDAANRII